MTVVTMWRRGELECLLVFNGEHVSIRLLNGTVVLRQQTTTSAESAFRTSATWEREDQHGARAAVLSANARAGPLC